MRFRSFAFLFGLGVLAPCGSVFAAASTDTVIIETAKTSIYVGSVTLTMTPFQRLNDGYEADYEAKVFPYFFSNENGHLRIEFSDADLAALARGETVQFKGNAANSHQQPRRIEGRAVPGDPQNGKIKVRVFVSPKIELIFNTTYRFGLK